MPKTCRTCGCVPGLHQPTLILQPAGSSLCGQTCVAMVAGVSLDEAIAAVGHAKSRGTHTKELVSALRELGVRCADKVRVLRRVNRVLPKRGIVAVHVSAKLHHWVLVWDGQIFDPGGVWPVGGVLDDRPEPKGWRFTSYLEIRA